MAAIGIGIGIGMAAEQVAGANKEALAKVNAKKDEAKEEMARSKSIAKGEVSAGEMLANNAYDKRRYAGPSVEMSVASEYKQLLSVSGSPQITPVLLLILRASC